MACESGPLSDSIEQHDQFRQLAESNTALAAKVSGFERELESVAESFTKLFLAFDRFSERCKLRIIESTKQTKIVVNEHKALKKQMQRLLTALHEQSERRRVEDAQHASLIEELVREMEQSFTYAPGTPNPIEDGTAEEEEETDDGEGTSVSGSGTEADDCSADLAL